MSPIRTSLSSSSRSTDTAVTLLRNHTDTKICITALPLRIHEYTLCVGNKKDLFDRTVVWSFGYNYLFIGYEPKITLRAKDERELGTG